MISTASSACAYTLPHRSDGKSLATSASDTRTHMHSRTRTRAHALVHTHSRTRRGCGHSQCATFASASPVNTDSPRLEKMFKNLPTWVQGVLLGLLSPAACANSSARGLLFSRVRGYEVHFWMTFRYVVLAGPLGRAFGGTFLDDFSLRRACRAPGESVLEVHFWMTFRYVVLAGPLGRAFWRNFCVLGWLLR